MARTEEAPVVWTIRDGIAVVEFNRPDSRNPMTEEVQSGFAEALDHLSTDPNITALIVTGRGRAFSAGGDMELMRMLPTLDPETARRRLSDIYPPFTGLLRFPTPTIAAVNGPAVGGGLGIALLCDIRIAARTATLSAPFGLVGLPPGMGLTFLLPYIIGHASAMDLLLTGDRWDAEHAEARGLVQHVVDDDQVLDRAFEIGRRISSGSPDVVGFVLEELRGRIRRGVDEALAREVRAQALTVGTANYQEGLDALSERRAPEFTRSGDR